MCIYIYIYIYIHTLVSYSLYYMFICITCLHYVLVFSITCLVSYILSVLHV